MKTIIIENESQIRIGLKTLLDSFCPEIELVGEAEGVKSGFELIQKTIPELIFLDIEMDDGTGMDLLKLLPNRQFQVIFVTAYDKYAVQAFRFSAIDFLLKPIDPEELIQAVEKAKAQKKNIDFEEQLLALSHNLNASKKGTQKLIVKESDTLHVLKITDILSCEAAGSYTTFHISNSPSILVSKNLKEYQKLLESHGFLRIHHSHLVNLNEIVRYEKSGGGKVILTNNKQLPVSFRKREELLKKLSEL